MSKIRFGIVGTGWRALFYFRIAKALPHMFEVCGAVTRKKERIESLARDWGINGFNSVDGLLAEKPSFIVTSVPWSVNPDLLRELARKGVPTMTETPPAPDEASLVSLYKDLKALKGKVQVAEEYHRRPNHMAQMAVAATGKMGGITHAQVSVGHGYHGISLLRRFLGIGSEPPRLLSRMFKSPIVEGGGREQPPEKEVIRDSEQEIYIFDWGKRTGVMDFTGDQYSYLIRGERVLLRGERGELSNSSFVFLKDPRTPIRQEMGRHYSSALVSASLRGIQAGAEWVYQNPYHEASLTDDEVAIADCLKSMDEYARTGKPFYPVEEGMQDHYLYLLAQKVCKQDGSIMAEKMPWDWS